MPEPLDEHVLELARGRSFAVMVTLMPDGQPQAQVTWIDTDGQFLLVNTEHGRQRVRNVQRDPRVSLVLLSPESAYDFVEVRGRVVEIVEGELPHEHIQQLSRRYLGVGYPKQIESPRVLLKIAATRQVLHPDTVSQG